MALVGDIDAGVLQCRAARRPVQAPQPPELHVPSQRQGHEVGHHATRCQQAEAPLPVAHEVAQPAHDLLLHECRRRPGMPHIHALLRELGQQLADDGQQQWRWCEVAERARMPRVQLVGRDPVTELGQQISRRRWIDRRWPGTPDAPKNSARKGSAVVGSPIARRNASP